MSHTHSQIEMIESKDTSNEEVVVSTSIEPIHREKSHKCACISSRHLYRYDVYLNERDRNKRFKIIMLIITFVITIGVVLLLYFAYL